jgi:HSP20 family protein
MKNWPTRRANSYPAPWNSGLLHSSIDDLLEDFFGGFQTAPQTGVLAPRFEVSETDEDVVIEAELPGMDEKDIELSLQENVLTLKGEKKREEKTKKRNCYISERSYENFQRSL